MPVSGTPKATPREGSICHGDFGSAIVQVAIRRGKRPAPTQHQQTTIKTSRDPLPDHYYTDVRVAATVERPIPMALESNVSEGVEEE
jgi:hypothetical protein